MYMMDLNFLIAIFPFFISGCNTLDSMIKALKGSQMTK